MRYLPHQAVLTPYKSTTKLRVVYDASARSKNGIILNEAHYQGPIILPQLVGILLRARGYPIVAVGDVEKAFLQISLYPSERDVTRFLWVQDISLLAEGSNLIPYRFTRVPFGIVSSPFLLAAVLQRQLETENSWLANSIKENLHVDNVLIGITEREQAKKAYTEAKQIFKSALMNLRDFYTNDESLASEIPEGGRGTKKKSLSWG